MSKVDIKQLMQNGNDPAYPAEVKRHWKGDVLITESMKAEAEGPFMHTQDKSAVISYPGLTKREMFAMSAMHGLLSFSHEKNVPNKSNVKYCTEMAVYAADELLKQLEA